MAGEVQQRVEQHRAVPGREHETVAVGPARVGGIVFQEAGPQAGGGIGHAHRHAGMAGLRLLHRIHRQRADGVGHAALLGDRTGQQGRLGFEGGGGAGGGSLGVGFGGGHVVLGSGGGEAISPGGCPGQPKGASSRSALPIGSRRQRLISGDGNGGAVKQPLKRGSSTIQ
jgi:hypothetical protein